MATTGGSTGNPDGARAAHGIPTSAEELPVPERGTTFGDVMGMIAGGIMIIGTLTVVLGTIGYMIYSMLS